MRSALFGLAVLAVLAVAIGSAQAGTLTYQVYAELDFPGDDVSFSGTFVYDTDAPDQLVQTNAGRFELSQWNLLVDINGSQTLVFATGSATGSLTQGVNPTQLILSDESGNQLGFNVDFAGADPNVAPVIPNGTLLTYGFLEGPDVPAGINDTTVPTVGSPTLISHPSLPWCPDPVYDAEGFFPCPCPPCMAPCQFPAAPQGECKGPDGSVAVSSFACCCCGGSDNLFRPFTPYAEIERSPAGSMLVWDDMIGADAFDVVRGDLELLRLGAGNYQAATGDCAGDATPGTSLFVDDTPEDGACIWYLIRGNDGGSYDSASGSQAAPRDASIAASGNDCQ